MKKLFVVLSLSHVLVNCLIAQDLGDKLSSEENRQSGPQPAVVVLSNVIPDVEPLLEDAQPSQNRGKEPPLDKGIIPAGRNLTQSGNHSMLCFSVSDLSALFPSLFGATVPTSTEAASSQLGRGLVSASTQTDLEHSAVMTQAVVGVTTMSLLAPVIVQNVPNTDAVSAWVVAENVSIEKPLAGWGVNIPEIARGHEAEYLRFLSGKLVYKPNHNSNSGRIEFPIASLTDPLSGIFDIGCCEDGSSLCYHVANYFVFSTGCEIKGDRCQIVCNINFNGREIKEKRSKVGVWLIPRFLVEIELNGSAEQFHSIWRNWPSMHDIAVVWRWNWGASKWNSRFGFGDHISFHNTACNSTIALGMSMQEVFRQASSLDCVLSPSPFLNGHISTMLSAHASRFYYETMNL